MTHLGNCTACAKEFDSVLDATGGICSDCTPPANFESVTSTVSEMFASK